jgi:hypothetical protein
VAKAKDSSVLVKHLRNSLEQDMTFGTKTISHTADEHVLVGTASLTRGTQQHPHRQQLSE